MNKKDKDELLSIILNEEYPTPSWTSRDEPIFEVTPKEYFDFAQEDLQGNGKKSLVNSFTNVKRSIDCRIDSILFFLGYYEKLNRKNLNFPKKIEFLRELEIVSPNILKKINKTRNRIEHEYKYPSKGAVEDALDITELFLESTEGYMRVIHGFYIDLSKNDRFVKFKNGVLYIWELEYLYNPKQRSFKISLVGKESFNINESNPVFTPLLKQYVKSIRNM